MAMQILEEGPRNLVISFTGAGPDTVDVSALSPPCEELRILKVIYDCPNEVTAPTTLEWDATVDVTALSLHGHSETMCFESFGGLVNNAGAGVTGDVIVTKGDASTSLIVHFKKVRTQSPYPN
jgi:hypothetical protein